MVLSLVFSFLVVSFLGSQVFFAGTPRINPDFIAKVKNAPLYISSLPGEIVNSFKLNVTHSDSVASTKYEIKSTLDEASTEIPKTGLSFTNVATNVMAADDPNDSNIKYVKLESGAEVSVRKKVITDENGNQKTIKIVDFN